MPRLGILAGATVIALGLAGPSAAGIVNDAARADIAGRPSWGGGIVHVPNKGAGAWSAFSFGTIWPKAGTRRAPFVVARVEDHTGATISVKWVDERRCPKLTAALAEYRRLGPTGFQIPGKDPALPTPPKGDGGVMVWGQGATGENGTAAEISFWSDTGSVARWAHRALDDLHACATPDEPAV